MPNEILVIERGELALGRERPAEEGAWHAVELPDFWGWSRRTRSVEGWYRFRVPRDAAALAGWPADTRVGVLLPRAGLNSELFVNGISLGSHGRMTPPVARNLSNPQYFSVPPPLWHAGENELLLHLVLTPGVVGLLRPLVIGPEALVAPHFARLDFLHTTLPLAFGMTALLVAFALVLQGLATPGPSPSTPLGIAVFLLAFTYIAGSLRDVPVPSRVFEWTVNAAVCGAALPLTVWTARHFGLDRRRPIRGLAGVWIAAAIASAIVPAPAAVTVMTLWFLLALACCVIVVGTFVRRGRWRDHWGARLGVALGIGLLLLIVLIFVLAGRPPHPIWSPADLAPALVAVGTLALAGSYLVRAVRTTESLNQELEARVAQREDELARSHQQLRGLERARAIADERERMTRDMHDGTGGQLVSALTMLRGGRATNEEIEETLQSALDDLRVSIESLAPEGRDLPAVLGLLRARLARQARQRGIELDWQVGSVGEDEPLTPADAMHVTRIVQEAVTNAVRHSGAGRVTVRSAAGAEASSFVLDVTDDGTGGARPRPGGRGLPNLEHRARELGGTLSVRSGETGTVVRLEVPRARS